MDISLCWDENDNKQIIIMNDNWLQEHALNEIKAKEAPNFRSLHYVARATRGTRGHGVVLVLLNIAQNG